MCTSLNSYKHTLRKNEIEYECGYVDGIKRLCMICTSDQHTQIAKFHTHTHAQTHTHTYAQMQSVWHMETQGEKWYKII